MICATASPSMFPIGNAGLCEVVHDSVFDQKVPISG